MGIVEIVLIGIALSADAMSVTACNILADPGMPRSKALGMPVLFGLFQGGMPVLGCIAGSLAASFIESYAGIVAFCILGVIGGKMIWDGLHGEEDAPGTRLSWPSMAVQAVATSIDAFAVGVTLLASGAPILQSACIITLCTFLLCCLMLAVGRRAGALLGRRAQVIGGVVLVAIGLKALVF